MRLKSLHRCSSFKTDSIVFIFTGIDLVNDFLELVQCQGFVKPD